MVRQADGTLDEVRIDPRQWPGRVVPVVDSEVNTAIESICLRAQWPDADHDELANVLHDWFDAGWCVDAILWAVDQTPAGERQRRRSSRQAPHLFLKNRLRNWFADSGNAANMNDRVDPPFTGTSFGEWYRINRRNELTNRPRKTSSLTSEGQQARERARTTARTSRRNPIANARARGMQRDQALDSLLVPDKPAPQIEPYRRVRPRNHTTRMLCNWVATTQIVSGDAGVQRALEIVSRSSGAPTSQAVAMLRNAVRAARFTAQMAAVDAISGSDRIASSPLSNEAKRILSYVNQAIETDMPFNVLVLLLRCDIDLETRLPRNASSE